MEKLFTSAIEWFNLAEKKPELGIFDSTQDRLSEEILIYFKGRGYPELVLGFYCEFIYGEKWIRYWSGDFAENLFSTEYDFSTIYWTYSKNLIPK